MNIYLALFICSIALLGLIFCLRLVSRGKVTRMRWVERLETIAKDNHTVWSTNMPYSQKDKVINELSDLKKVQEESGLLLQVSESGQWHSPVDLVTYPAIKRLFSKLLPQIIAYSRTLGLDPKYLTLKAWTEFGDETRESASTTSEDALFSGRYCLEGSEKKGGEVSFYKKYGAEHRFATFLSRSGDLLLYPSDMRHKASKGSQNLSDLDIHFDVHFGNKKKSWLLSKITNLEETRSQDPFYETAAQSNKDETRQSTFVHISKIK